MFDNISYLQLSKLLNIPNVLVFSISKKDWVEGGANENGINIYELNKTSKDGECVYLLQYLSDSFCDYFIAYPTTDLTGNPYFQIYHLAKNDDFRKYNNLTLNIQ